MKISNELKVGILGLLAIAALILGFRFLKGKDIFNRTPKIYAIFESIGSLEKSNFVKINGLTVGTVYAIEPADANVSRIKVTINLTQDVNVPTDSKAYISGSLLGPSLVVIEKGKATSFLNDGDIINTRVDAGLLGDLSSEAKPLMGKVKTVADSLTLLLSHVNNILDAPTQHNLQGAIANLNYTVASLNNMVTNASKPLTTTLNNFSDVSDNLKKNNAHIEGILSNANQFTGNLKEVKLQQTMDSLNLAVSEMRRTINQISSTNGSIGALMHDRELYNRLNQTILSAEILLDDVRVHPKRYVNISVFGKKNKSGELTSPAIKDTVPK